MILALTLAASLMTADTPPDRGGGEPLPPGAPTDSYELAAWCYGALDEYLTIYQRVKPDLRDIDHMFGTPVVENDPYHSDMAAYRVELKMIGDSVTEAEKASPRPIAEEGASAIKQGRAIWSIAETKTGRELARAWMLWALPDRCDSNARELAQRSVLFGKALNYNNAPPASASPAPAPADQPPVDQQLASPNDPGATPPADMAPTPPPAAGPDAQASPSADTNVPASPSTDASGAPAAPSPSPAPPDSPPVPPPADPGVPPYPTAAPADQPQPTQP